jgi:hypothetical protein
MVVLLLKMKFVRPAGAILTEKYFVLLVYPTFELEN